MAEVEHGCLMLADIGGYTKYLSGVELDHSHDILADLMGVVADQLRGGLQLAKLEGDAVFCYGSDKKTDGPMLLTMVESCYFAFAQRLQTIERQTTCQCNACRLIPRLNLKFLTHHGGYVQQLVAGSRELVGSDVVLAHRLLKNAITTQTGLHGYAFFTQPCIDNFALDAGALGLREYRERYDDVGEVVGYVHNLEARWAEEQARRAVYVPQTVPGLEYDVPVPPPVIWDYLTSPAKRPLWQVDTLRVDQRNPRGTRGIGTTNHCVHGKLVSIHEEVLDWKPFRYYTLRSKASVLGEFLVTVEVTPLTDGTTSHVSMRLVPRGGRVQQLALRIFAGRMRKLQTAIATGRDNLVRLLSTGPRETVVSTESPH